MSSPEDTSVVQDLDATIRNIRERFAVLNNVDADHPVIWDSNEDPLHDTLDPVIETGKLPQNYNKTPLLGHSHKRQWHNEILVPHYGKSHTPSQSAVEVEVGFIEWQAWTPREDRVDVSWSIVTLNE